MATDRNCAAQGGDLMNQNSTKRHMLPVWLFVGVILLIYGVLILASGIYQVFHPPDTILANLHPALWWGALLIVIGTIYVGLFMPRKA
jgi:hypothetical protein